MKIIDDDFNATFDGIFWSVEWKWKEGEPSLSNNVAIYKIPKEAEDGFVSEIDSWVDESWLVETNDHVGPIVPLMVVIQPSKNKVRQVMDFIELTEFVNIHCVCGDSLRSWRTKSFNPSMLDLRRAYLQIHVYKNLSLIHI